MTALRFEFTDATGASTIGPVRGAGGMLESAPPLEAATRLAKSGRRHHLYEPSLGCVAVYERYGAECDGPETVVDLRATIWREVPS